MVKSFIEKNNNPNINKEIKEGLLRVTLCIIISIKILEKFIGEDKELFGMIFRRVWNMDPVLAIFYLPKFLKIPNIKRGILDDFLSQVDTSVIKKYRDLKNTPIKEVKEISFQSEIPDWLEREKNSFQKNKMKKEEKEKEEETIKKLNKIIIRLI